VRASSSAEVRKVLGRQGSGAASLCGSQANPRPIVLGDLALSDFGSSVAVYRSDGQALSAERKERIRTAARSLQFSREDHIGPYDEFDLRFSNVRGADGSEGVSVDLSSYFIDDEAGNDGLDPDVIIAREEPIAEQFAEDLARALGSDYRCIAYSGHW
jgi:hypothetical protein